MTWNDLAPIWRVVALTLAILAIVAGLLGIIGALWLLARRMLWAVVRHNPFGSEIGG